MLLQPLVENAVNHGIFHKSEPGHITISFKQLVDNFFEVVIEDDGIGVNMARELYARSSQKFQSRSSLVLQERLELLNQTKYWDIAYEIMDMSEQSDETGTRIRLIFNQRFHEEN